MAGRGAVEIYIENEKFTVVCTHFHQNLKFGNFSLSLNWQTMSKNFFQVCACMCSRIIFPHSTNQIIVFCHFPCLSSLKSVTHNTA